MKTTDQIKEWSKERIFVLSDEIKAHYQRPMTGDLDYNFLNQMVCFTNTQLQHFYGLAHADGKRDARDTDAKAWQGAASKLATNDEVNEALKEEIERLRAKLKEISESGIWYGETPFDAYMRLRSMAL